MLGENLHHQVEISVEQVNDLAGGELFAFPGEGADIGEENGDELGLPGTTA